MPVRIRAVGVLRSGSVNGAEEVGRATSLEARLRSVIDVGVAITAELSLDDLLGRVAESASRLTGARFAALGVIDQRGSELERFITYGVDEETRRRIGELPRGRGILGALIRDSRPLRLEDLHSDPRSVGFPPGHPAMASFLGVPIFLRGVTYGNLYLSEKEDGTGFTEEDEQLIELLAAQAAVAIENARLYESSVRWMRQLESLAEVSKALSGEFEPRAVLELICVRLCELVDARLVYLTERLPDGSLEITTAAGERATALIGRRLDPARSKSAAVMQRRSGERVDAMLDDLEADRSLAREWGIRSAIFVPLMLQGEPIGVLVANDRLGPDSRFGEADYRLVQEFADRAAVALDLARRVQRDTVARILSAQEAERKRIARELHDETAQALTAILLGLKSFEVESPEATQQLAALVRDALASVRKLAVDLRPAVLDDFGLIPALERLRDDLQLRTATHISVTADGVSTRLDPDIETALYRVAQEAVANAIRHGDAQTIRIQLDQTPADLYLTVTDDGRGFDPDRVPAHHFGLIGMQERIALVHGHLTVDSTPGKGTTITVQVPLDRSASSH